MIKEEQVKQMEVESAKEKGNVHFRRGEWELAIEAYNQAIEHNHRVHVGTSGGAGGTVTEGLASIDLDLASSTSTSTITLEITTDSSRVQSAQLLSNRAAAKLHLFQHDQALLDSELANQLQPNWPRAWARKAEAFAHLHDYQASVAAYERAIKLAEEERDETSTKRLKSSRKAVEQVGRASQLLSSRPDTLYLNSEDTPHERYTKLLKTCEEDRDRIVALETEHPTAASVAFAFEWCSAGIEGITHVKVLPNGGIEAIPHEAINCFAQCLIHDARGFHPPLASSVSDLKEFIEKMELQIRFDRADLDTLKWNGTTTSTTSSSVGKNSGKTKPYSVEEILDDLEKRVDKDGGDWTKSSKALESYLKTLLVLAWTRDLNNDLMEAIHLYEQIINLLLTADLRWSKPSPEAIEDSEVFNYTWGRKVRCLYIQALQKAHRQSLRWADSTSLTFDDLSIPAEAIIDECASTSGLINSTTSPRSFYSFQAMPIAEAGALIGYVLGERARLKENRRKEGVCWFYNQGMSLAAGKMYAQAAKTLPLDSPERPGFLYCALLYEVRAGSGLTIREFFERASEAEKSYSISEQIFGPGEREIEPRWAIREVAKQVRKKVLSLMKENQLGDYQTLLDSKLSPVPDVLKTDLEEFESNRSSLSKDKNEVFCCIESDEL